MENLFFSHYTVVTTVLTTIQINQVSKRYDNSRPQLSGARLIMSNDFGLITKLKNFYLFRVPVKYFQGLKILVDHLSLTVYVT